VPKNKYSIILLAGGVIFFIYSAVKRLIPYIASCNLLFGITALFQIGLGFLLYGILVRIKIAWVRICVLLIFFFDVGICFLLSYSHDAILRPIGESWLMLGLTLCSLGLYQTIRDRKNWDKKTENGENLSKGLFLFLLVMIIVFSIVFGIIFGILSCAE
jgi:hypothetical protein